MDLAVLRAWLQAEEGLVRVGYLDSRGQGTIGYGHKLSEPISLRAANLILDDDLAAVVGQMQTRMTWTNTLTDVRQCVIGSMAFNLGLGGVSEFTTMIAALKIGDYAGAADAMLASAWARQVGTRAHVLAERMRTGVA
jgi:lysozyme